MKSLLSLLACIFCLSFILGCAETDNPVAQETDESLFPLAENIPPSGYPDGWVKLTDEDVEELMKMEILPNWHNMNISQEWKNKYNHAQLLKQFGDTPQVRFIIEFQRNPGFEISHQLFVAYFQAHYHLFPTENNRRALEEARNIENQPRPEPPETQIKRVPITIELAEEIRAELIRKHGNIPQVHTVANFYKKVARNISITYDNYLPYLEARSHLDPQNEHIRQKLETYKKAKAEGIPFHLVDEAGRIMLFIFSSP